MTSLTQPPQEPADHTTVIFDLKAESITTTMGESARMKGDLIQPMGIFFDGQGQGNFEATNSTIIIGPNAFIEGSVSGRRVFILGKVKGTIRASEHLVLGQTAHTSAAMHFKTIDVRDGARPGGQLIPHGFEELGSPSLEAVARLPDVGELGGFSGQHQH